MGKIISILRTDSGSALIIVLITFLVLSIFTLSVIYINMTNTRQVVYQAENMQAYYLAYSGVEIGYAALMTDNKSLFNEFISTPNYNITDKVYYGENNQDEIDITIKTSSDNKTIKITSVGIHKKSGTKKSLRCLFQ